MSHDIVTLGAATLDPDTSALILQCKGAPVDEDGTAPDYGKAPLFQCLGLTAMPWPANENGAAQGIVATDIPGMEAALVGARDTRTADIVGTMRPGDTVMHSTDPEKAAQLQLKGDRRQAALLSRDSQGRTMMALLDGTNDKVQITALGAHFEITPEGNIILTCAGGNGIIIDSEGIHHVGKTTGGTPVPGLSVALCTPAGYPLGGIVASQTAFFG
jgi:hypothetical protein